MSSTDNKSRWTILSDIQAELQRIAANQERLDRHMQQKFDLAFNVSRMRGEAIARLENINGQLRDETTKMNEQLANVQAALDELRREINRKD